MFVFLMLLVALPAVVTSVGRALQKEPPALPGLTERESADFLWLDWMLSVGLYDAAAARRYVALASSIDSALGSHEVDERARGLLSAIRCDGCGEAWGTAAPGCERCTWPDGSPLPLEWRVPL